MVHESEEVILHGGGGAAATQREKALLKERVPDFLRRLCAAETDGDEPILLESTIVTLSTTRLPQVDRLRVPLPANHKNHPAGGDDDAAGDEINENETAYVRLFSKRDLYYYYLQHLRLNVRTLIKKFLMYVDSSFQLG